MAFEKAAELRHWQVTVPGRLVVVDILPAHFSRVTDKLR